MESNMLQLALGVFFVHCACAAEPQPSKPGEASLRVECHGKLRHGVVAIGGETTGTTLSFDGTTWELKLPDEASRTFVKEHHKQPITASGVLRRVVGTAVPVRWILEVERLSKRDDAVQKEGASVTVLGKLRAGDAATEAPGMVIEAVGTTWRLDLSANAAIQAQAESLVGKSAVLMGRLERGSDATSPPRPFIRVNKLEEATDRPLPK